MHDIRIRNVCGRAENSVRVSGSEASAVRNVRLENVDVTLDRWTRYNGGILDNRPTATETGLEPHGNPGYAIRHASQVTIKASRIAWGNNRPDYFTHALESENTTGLDLSDFSGTAAHPGRDSDLAVK